MIWIGISINSFASGTTPNLKWRLVDLSSNLGADDWLVSQTSAFKHYSHQVRRLPSHIVHIKRVKTDVFTHFETSFWFPCYSSRKCGKTCKRNWAKLGKIRKRNWARLAKMIKREWANLDQDNQRKGEREDKVNELAGSLRNSHRNAETRKKYQNSHPCPTHKHTHTHTQTHTHTKTHTHR